MKLDFTNLPGELKPWAEEAAGEIGLDCGKHGISVEIFDFDGLRVEKNRQKLAIGFREKHLFFRALLICAAKSDAEWADGFVVEEHSNIKNFGVMADCSRNAVLNIDAVKKLIRHLALMGYNELQLYAEDTYECGANPFHGYLRGKYTKDELKEADAYASAFGIELVPCVQTLAHFTAMSKWWKCREMFDFDDILLVGEQGTYDYIDKILSACAECFTSKRINIGMDEAHMLGLGRYLDKNGFKNRQDIMCEHLERVCGLCKKYGFKPMMWSDMFYRLAFKDYYSTGEIPEEVIKKLPKDVELVYWDYYSTDPNHYKRMISSHQKFSNKLGFAGGGWKWMGFTPHNRFSMKTFDAAMPICEKSGVEHVFITKWGGNGAECSTFAMLPSLLAAAEKAYGKDINDEKCFSEMLFALTGKTSDSFMNLDLPDEMFADGIKGERFNPSKYLFYNDCFMGMFDTTLNGGEAERYGRAAKLIQKDTGGKWGYIFEASAALSRVLKVKSDLGVRTRAAYKSGKTEQLKALADADYTTLLVLIEDFHKKFRIQWCAENKPQGFEVQDARIGGVLMRIKSCRETIYDYVKGNIKEITELEEELIDIETGSGEFSKKPIVFNRWEWNISGNVV